MANYEQLFLLEVLVDRVKLLTRALEAFAPECEDEPDSPVRIRVKFSDFPCFEITQDLAPPSKERNNSDPLTTPIVFSSGKSCMFPMDPEQLMQDLIKYPMAVSVFKKNPELPLPEIIGQTKIPLGDYMSNIIKRASEWSLEEPLSEMIQDTFPLRNQQEQDVGTITMLIRLTCFGKTIITKFQIADNKKSFLFKNAKTQDYEFKCKKCMPGQPILRQRPNFGGTGEDTEEEEPGWEGENFETLPCVEKPQTMDRFQEMSFLEPAPMPQPPYSPMNKDMHTQGPGFQKHEFQGPGFTASMEVTYPDDCQDNPNAMLSPPVESQSTPVVKKEKEKGKSRGKSLDSKKVDLANGVKLGNTKRKRRTKFHVPQGIAYPGVILGHKYCVNQGPPVPAKNGWAWKTSVPYGMKPEDVRGRRPGAYLKQAWVTLKAMEELRMMGKRKKLKRVPVLPDTRKTTVHIHRIKGIYHVTLNPVKGPDDKEEPEPVVYTLERPEDGSDVSELELDLTVPDPPYPPPPELKHQAQQFCEEDLPLIQPKPVFIKKKKKKEKAAETTSTTSKKKPTSAKSGGSTKSKTEPAPKVPMKGKEPPDASKKNQGQKKEAGAGGKKGAVKGKEESSKGAPSGKGGPSKGAPAGKAGQSKGAPAGKAGPSKGSKQLPPPPPPPPPQPETADNRGRKKGKGKKKGDDDDDIYPWEDWIMKLKCKNKQSPDDIN